MAAKVKRGYSVDFTPHGATGKRYLLDLIPAGFWAAVRLQAKRDGISIRALILTLLKDWLASRQAATPIRETGTFTDADDQAVSR